MDSNIYGNINPACGNKKRKQEFHGFINPAYETNPERGLNSRPPPPLADRNNRPRNLSPGSNPGYENDREKCPPPPLIIDRSTRPSDSSPGSNPEQGPGKKQQPVLLYILLALCLLATVGILIAGVVKFSQSSAELVQTQSDFSTQLSGLTNFSEVVAELERRDRMLRNKLSELQKSSTECSTKLAAMENKFNREIPRLQRSDAEILNNVSSLQKDADNLRMKLCLNPSDSQCTPCATGWKYFKGKCYYFSTLLKNWHNANLQCFLTWSQLIVINNEEEHDFVSSTIMNQRYWIGLSDIAMEGQWRWVDGTESKATRLFWAPGEPNNHGKSEHCAHTMEHGTWNDVPCTITYKWICERPSLSYFIN
ncbi:C-type lectin domain family 10 member A-like [Heptranchias perlo]|uniref:C-type lectin domain family 10 member A-like n=1 Tax=Heptranchias perlo TaxID=212740 RepID=UPI0035596051